MNPYAFCAFVRCGFLPTRGATTKNLGEVGILWRPRSVQRPWYPVEPWSVIPEFCNFTWQFLMDHEVISNTFERCQDVTDAHALQCVPNFIFQHGSKSWPSWRSKKSKHWNLVILKFLFPSISLMSLAHGTAPRRGCGVKYISTVEFWSIFAKKPFTFKIRPQRLNIGLFPSTLASFHYIFFKIDKCTAAPKNKGDNSWLLKRPISSFLPFLRTWQVFKKRFHMEPWMKVGAS